MLMEDIVSASQAKAADLQKQIDDLTNQITMLTAQRDLHNAAAASLLAMADEQRAAINILIQEKSNG